MPCFTVTGFIMSIFCCRQYNFARVCNMQIKWNSQKFSWNYYGLTSMTLQYDSYLILANALTYIRSLSLPLLQFWTDVSNSAVSQHNRTREHESFDIFLDFWVTCRQLTSLMQVALALAFILRAGIGSMMFEEYFKYSLK